MTDTQAFETVSACRQVAAAPDDLKNAFTPGIIVKAKLPAVIRLANADVEAVAAVMSALGLKVN